MLESDDRLDARRAAEGDTAAFERLYRRHVPRVHSLALRMLGPELADETTQDVFVRVWQKLDTYRGEAKLSTWMHRVAVNLILAQRKKLGIQRARSHPDAEGALQRVAGPKSTPELKPALERAIQALPEGAREVFVLHDVEGYKHREIAEMLGVTSGTTKAQLHRARMMLRQRLQA
ncbi:MAG: sigma-70 family RNA polymerase sigma factor [Gemmatimonadota bacterium]